ncbi:MAG: ZIP family metal transporter [Limibacillus sp.]|jgi:ZIP family zinc transporter
MFEALQQWPVLVTGSLGSLAAGLCTGLGALPILFGLGHKVKGQAMLLAVAAGIMLGATVFSLILPAMERVEIDQGAVTAALVVGAGVLIGALVIWQIHNLVPHQHFEKGKEGALGYSLGRNWLFIIAITLHNFPEGLSVGVGFGTDDVSNGLSIMIGIGLQNMPEGLAVAAALVSEGFTRRYAFLVALLTGLVEPVGGIIGAAAVSFGDAVLPWALASSAGAMLYVISGEVIPETHREGRESRATLALVAGFVVMMFLDVTLG